MSVINQMLQDLENRKPVNDPHEPFSGQVKAVSRREGVYSGWWAIMLLGLTMVIVGSLWTVLSPGNQPGERGVRANSGSLSKPLPGNAARLAPTVQTQALVSTSTAVPAAASPVATVAPLPDTTVAEKPVAVPDQLASFGLKSTTLLDLSRSDRTAPPLPRTVPHPSAILPEKPLPPMPVATAPVIAATAAQREARVTTPPAVASVAPVALSAPSARQIKEVTPRQRADSDYGKALVLLQEERTTEAAELLNNTLQLDPGNSAARQTQVSMLLGAKRYSEAERSLQDGLRVDRNQITLAMILARLQVEQGDVAAGLKTLQQHLSAGADRAEYQGFLAALLQREGRHREAIEHYQQALRRVPASGVWLTGLGISLQAENRTAEAQDAFGRAQASNSLSPDLKGFVDQQLRQGGAR